MSASVKYRQRPVEPKGVDASYLTHILKNKYDLISGPVVLSKSDISFLEGIIAAGDEYVGADAKRLISAIIEYREVEIYLEF